MRGSVEVVGKYVMPFVLLSQTKYVDCFSIHGSLCISF
jgi:hypothetical protein